MEPGVVGRFAPTPSGRLHLGNLFAPCWPGCRPGRPAGGWCCGSKTSIPPGAGRNMPTGWSIILRFLGLDWDEGGSRAAPHPPYYQQECTQRYAALLIGWGRRGWYIPASAPAPSFMPPTRPMPPTASRFTTDGAVDFPGGGRRAFPRARPALPSPGAGGTIAFTDGHYGPVRQFLPSECDFILRRSDGVFAYQLAVVADDAAMEITQVVPGRGLLLSTPASFFCTRLLGLTPPRFFHTPLPCAGRPPPSKGPRP